MRRSIRFLVVAFALGNSHATKAQDTAKAQPPKAVDVSLGFLTDANIVELTIDADPLVAWVNPVLQGVEKQFQGEKRKRTVVVQVTLHPGKPAEVAAAGDPALSAEETKWLLKTADPARAPRARIVDCSFRIVAKINGGIPDETVALKPNLQSPYEIFGERFTKATLPEKLASMKAWARNEAIPILAAASARADEKFAGVRNLGKAIEKLDPAKPINVSQLVDKNADFWRALMEMAPRNLHVPAIAAALHVANGEIDYARRIAQGVAFFDDHQTGASRLLGELNEMMAAFHADADARIEKGIALHDKEKYDDALAVYGSLLKEYPHSAWARYEYFHTSRMKAIQAGKEPGSTHAGWPLAHKSILACDPLYPSMAAASGPDEIFQLVRRAEINGLFKDPKNPAANMVAYADVARDVDAYGVAAILYWNALTSIKPEEYGNRPILESFLYCLEKLGVTTLKDNFKGDHAAEFLRIEQDKRRRVMAVQEPKKEAAPAAKKP